MRREELEHIIRACAEVTGDTDIVVVGSQAILASFPNAPRAMLVSIEADVYPRNIPDEGDRIDAVLGELTRFHEQNQVYAHLVGPETAKAPAGWEERLVPVHNVNTGEATGWCLESHDLVLSKLARSDAKDREFAANALAYGLVKPEELEERLPAMPLSEPHKSLVAGALRAAIVQAASAAAPGGSHTVLLLHAAESGRHWVQGHRREGHPVRGYWRG